MLNSPVLSHRSNGLDALRAVFALWVLLAHALPWAEAVSSGQVPTFLLSFGAGLGRLFQTRGETHPAVLGFIVLSGYCIHRAGLRSNRTDVQQYSQRRFWRIAPVYLVASTVGALAVTLAGSISPLGLALAGGGVNGWCMAAKLLGLPAWFPSLFACSFAGNAPLGTVTAEIGLYTLYPVLLILIGMRMGERAIWLSVSVVFLAGVLFVSIRPELGPWWHNGSVVGFLAYWWLGVKLLDPDFAKRLRRFAAPIILGWLILTLALMTSVWPAASPLLIEARKLLFCFAIGIAIVALDRAGQRAGVLSWVGRRGYSLYAFHAPVLYLLLVAGVPWWLAISAAIGLGLLAYRVVEAPGSAMPTPRH